MYCFEMNEKAISVLIKLMEKHALSPYDLAFISGISQPTIHRFLTGQTDMNNNTARKIAAALKVSVGQLRGETPLNESDYDDETKMILDRLLNDPNFKMAVGILARMDQKSIQDLKSNGSDANVNQPDPKNNGTEHNNGTE